MIISKLTQLSLGRSIEKVGAEMKRGERGLATHLGVIIKK